MAALNHQDWITGDLGLSYFDLLGMVEKKGLDCAPRGQRIKEVSPLYLELANPQLCVADRKGHSKVLMWLEIASVLAGRFPLDLYEAVSSQAASMLSDQGAYGPRVRDQMSYVAAELERDKDSRRAVVYVGDQKDLRYSAHFEQPCTMTWQFLVREGRLDMIVNMRSWDLVWGLGYDVPVFTSVQQALARCLGVELGKYAHVAGSAHIYDRHWDGKHGAGKHITDGVALPCLYPIWAEGREPAGAVERWDNVVEDASEAIGVLRKIVTKDYPSLKYPKEWDRAVDAWHLWAERGKGA